MLLDYMILIALWPLGIICWYLFIPNNKRREGFLALMMFQAIIWFCDMPAFRFGVISAPVRLFPKATDLALTINYIFYPVLFSIFYVHMRFMSRLTHRVLSLLFWVSFITLFDIMIERYTDLLEYGFITWYGMWVYIGFLFYVSQVCCNWFFKDKTLFRMNRWKVQ